MPLHPIERFSRRHNVPMSFKKWDRLPRIPGYKNEYWDGEARYTPRHRTCDCYLDLGDWPPRPTPPVDPHPAAERVTLSRLRDEDWTHLPPVFHGAFGDQPPLCEWGRHAGARAARCILDWTRLGRDGPLVRDACVVAWHRDRWKSDHGPLHVCGCALVTLATGRLLRGVPADATIRQGEVVETPGIPHLTWVFVSRLLWRHGIATMLLAEVVTNLKRLGFRGLASTCLLANAPSLLWHWRSGFEAASYGLGWPVRLAGNSGGY